MISTPISNFLGSIIDAVVLRKSNTAASLTHYSRLWFQHIDDEEDIVFIILEKERTASPWSPYYKFLSEESL